MGWFKGTLLGAAGAAVCLTGLVASPAPSEAATCRGRMAGEGTGTGVAGAGTDAARKAALANWAQKVEARHGRRFTNTARARGVRYDCRTGSLIEAKCVVSAIPCR